MWKILHKLLGWHYVLYHDSATSMIMRVKTAPNGKLYVRDWTGTYHFFLAGAGRFEDWSGYYKPLTFTESADA